MRDPYGSLAQQHPTLADEWHPTANGAVSPDEVGPGSNFVATWLCPNGHEFSCSVKRRVAGHRCQGCSAGFYPAKRGRSLAVVRPDLAAEWVSAGDVHATPATARPLAAFDVTWRCGSCSWEWSATVQERYRGNGCPVCAKFGFNPAAPAIVYLMHHVGLRAWKVGIAGVGSNRVTVLRSLGWTLRTQERFSLGADARETERAIHRWWRTDLRLPTWLGPEDFGAVSGWTETIDAAELDEQTLVTRLRTEAARHRTR